ncbi:MAG TPA: ACP S-malonyltransferase [Phycisphaerales bacterium]|nr:ACP S-malonyltransferase [Phycisphaerales bacterium]
MSLPPQSWIVLCPGQGAQAVGMGKAWFDASPEAREVFARADALLGDRLGTKLTELCFAGPVDRLNRTDASQPAIYTASMACWTGWLAKQGLAPNDVAPSLVAAAGLSLGEYTALAIAGAFSFEDGLELVTLRGRAMQDAADSPAARAGGGGAMLALIGATDEQAATICDQSREADVLVCANFNAPGQVVLSGHKVACERAAKAAEAMGVRSAMLPVAGAFHSPLMAPAAQRLGEALARTTIRVPRSPVIANVTARAYGDGEALTPDTIRRRLAEQLTSPVRWSQSCQWLAANKPGEYHELAPGKTLMGLMRRIDKAVKVTTHDEP